MQRAFCSRWIALVLCMGTCAACSDTKFRTSDPDGSDGGLDAATDGPSVDGGDARSGEGGSPSDSGGDQGVSTDASDAGAGCRAACRAGEYCNSLTLACTPCTDLSRFRFAAPEPVVLRASIWTSQRFPRLTGRAKEMLYRGSDGTAFSLTVVDDPDAQNFMDPFPASINVPGQLMSGPLEARVDTIGEMQLYFDRSVNGVNSERELLVATRGGGLAIDGKPRALGEPFNSPTPGTSNYSIAVAGRVGRAWWMSTRSGGVPGIWTAELSAEGSDAGAASPVDIRLGSGTCKRLGADSAPWASPDGTFLLFNSVEVGGDCSSNAGASWRDLYLVAMQANGQTAANAVPLDDVNRPGVDETDGSLSPDSCWLYFSVNSSATQSAFRIYRARRH
jgi:hypothetical protein